MQSQQLPSSSGENMVMPLLGVLASPVAHVVKVLCELSQVWTLLFILLLGPKQHLRDLEKISRG